MQLSDIIVEVKDELNKGSSITDEQIARKVRATLVNLELKHTWWYMEKFVTFTIEANSDEPRVISLPSRPKSITFVRTLDEANRYHYAHEIDPRDQHELTSGVPEGYWKDSSEYLWFNSIPLEDYRGEMLYNQFTSWKDDDDFEPWLFKFAHPLIVYGSLVLLSPFARELELATIYSPLYTDALDSALNANSEAEFSNQPMRMGYGHE